MSMTTPRFSKNFVSMRCPWPWRGHGHWCPFSSWPYPPYSASNYPIFIKNFNIFKNCWKFIISLGTEVSALKRVQVNQDGNTWSVRNHKNLDKSQVLNMDLNVKPSSPVCHPSLRPKLKPSSRPGNLNISRKNGYSAYDMSHVTWLMLHDKNPYGIFLLTLKL